MRAEKESGGNDQNESSKSHFRSDYHQRKGEFPTLSTLSMQTETFCILTSE